jgi:cytoskeletal protein RodZ
MFIKALVIAGATGLIAGAAYAQSAQDQSVSPHSTPQNSALSPNTVNPPLAGSLREGEFSKDTAAPPSSSSSSLSSGATSASSLGADVSAISPDQARAQGIPVQMVASAPVPDTPANRAKYGSPMSNAGKRTAAKGN